MEFTGERMIPSLVDMDLELEHKNRYYFARQFTFGKNVLDAACGAGYGSKILSENAVQVSGIDISKETITYAQLNFTADNISYIVSDVTKLPFSNDSFDVIVSLETLEHISEKEQVEFMQEIKRVLKHDGILIISTPNKGIYNLTDKNSYHVNELTCYEFKSLLSDSFINLQFFSQKHEITNIITNEFESTASIKSGLDVNNAEYMIAVCSNYILPDINSQLYIKSEGELEKLKLWAISVHKESEDRIQHIQKQNNEIDDLKQRFDDVLQQHHTLMQLHDDLCKENDGLHQQFGNVLQQRDAILNSASWKITKPFRVIINILKGIINR